MVGWLKREQTEEGEPPLYPLKEAETQYDVVKLTGKGWLVLKRETDLWLKFAVLEFHSSDEKDQVTTTCLFHGEGTLGSLRECRHTYWGESGYLFYPNGPLITAALQQLSEFFDDMTT